MSQVWQYIFSKQKQQSIYRRVSVEQSVLIVRGDYFSRLRFRLGGIPGSLSTVLQVIQIGVSILYTERQTLQT